MDIYDNQLIVIGSHCSLFPGFFRNINNLYLTALFKLKITFSFKNKIINQKSY